MVKMNDMERLTGVRLPYTLEHDAELIGSVDVGDGAVIESGCIIGYKNLTHLRPGYDLPTYTEIGKKCLLRPNAVIYAGSTLRDGVHIGHDVILREFTKVGENTSIGNKTCCEGYTLIGKNVGIHTQVHLTAKMVIEDDVFIGPNVTTMNGKMPNWSRPHLKGEEKGPTIRRGAIIGGGATILPGVEIGRNVIVGAGSVVTKDLPKNRIYIGNPAVYFKDTPEEMRL